MKSEMNFRCPTTGKEFFIPHYKIKFPNGKATYVDEFNKPLVNSDNIELIPMEKEWDGGMPSSGTGKDEAGREQMKNMLKRRSTEDFKKNHKWNQGRMIHNFDDKGEQGL